MPGTPTITGDNTVLFGTEGYYSGSGVVTGGNNKLTSDKLELLDENGYVFATIYFNERNEFSFELTVKTAAPALEIGDLITVAGVLNAEVQGTELLFANNQQRKFRVDAVRYSAKTHGS